MLKSLKQLLLQKHSFLAYAFAICIIFLALHLAGGREYTSVLSATIILPVAKQYLGFAYIISYVFFVFVMPILAIAFIIKNIILLLLSRPTTRQEPNTVE